jgi:hypothetical protein
MGNLWEGSMHKIWLHSNNINLVKGQVYPDMLLCMEAEKLEKQVSESLSNNGHIIKKVMNCESVESTVKQIGNSV